ncbi:MarR family transcriptional regulator [Actinopolymorpha sp. B17G11]|uniref:MarR family winged helix-turn-helix transcriptional regulator n=1 Tax=unclassified Actinopolymorpha TaxID=2627063 RepID=UPI0032D8E108
MSEEEPSGAVDAEPSVERAVRTLVRVARLFKRADAGLSLAQFRTLELVSRGTERSTQIASRLATSKPAVTVVVDGLVAAGLLTRSSLAGDRRVIRLALTDEGRAALARAERAYCERLEPLLDEVSDRDRLLALLAELDDVMDARWATRRSPAPTTPEVSHTR